MKRILLIDDSAIQLRILKGILQDSYEILMATSGFEGLEIAKEKRPDLILLDYKMPMFDGKSTLKRLREKDETKNVPVVFLTGVNDKDDIKEVLELHPQGYLLKPVEPEHLFKVIHKILGK